VSNKLAVIGLVALTASGCDTTASMDLAGFPDKENARLYADGRLGGDKGLTNFDLRRTWRSITDSQPE
jgi:hypothetical protein